jgi:hypothetical protein
MSNIRGDQISKLFVLNNFQVHVAEWWRREQKDTLTPSFFVQKNSSVPKTTAPWIEWGIAQFLSQRGCEF